MPICAPGISQPKAISPVLVFLAGEALTATAVETLGLSAIWADLLGFAAGQSFNTTTFCAADPPTLTVPSAADIVAILTNNFVNSPVAYAHLNSVAAYAAWYALCECSSIPTPAPTSPPYPSGATQINPPGVVPIRAAAQCWNRLQSLVAPAGAPAQPIDLAPSMLPTNGTGVSVPLFVGLTSYAWPIPAGTKNVKITITPKQGSAHMAFDWIMYNAAGTMAIENLNVSYNQNTGAMPVSGGIANLNASDAIWAMAFSNGGSAAYPLELYDLAISWDCSGVGINTPITPCCPPDSNLQAQIQQILQLLQGLYSGLPTQANSYAESTVHAGLTGGGSFVLGTGVIAVKVAITTDNTSLGSIPGNPTYLLNRGFIVPIALEGPIRGQTRFVYNPQLYQLPPLADAIGYEFGAGVTASITELVRGP